MDRAGAAGDRSAMGFRVDYPNDLWDVAASTIRVGDGFDPSLGFVPRRAMYYHRLQVTNQMERESQVHLFTNLRGDWESERRPDGRASRGAVRRGRPRAHSARLLPLGA